MAGKKKAKKAGSLLLSRHRSARVAPKLFPSTAAAPLSSKAGRCLIRKHHTLQKTLSRALAQNDIETAKSVQAELDANGGLEKYQQASAAGQSGKRGGDSSKILMDWIRETLLASRDLAPTTTGPKNRTEHGLRLLEVGTLSSENTCSKSSIFSVTRIDLNSRDPKIESQDFMQRPLPKQENEKFNIISLSLVLNYVPLPALRGEMLRRTTKFFTERALAADSPLKEMFPSLFLVLPASCVTNSRYLDETRLCDIMVSLGYSLVKQKLSAKLIYQLWRFNGMDEKFKMRPVCFKKEEVNPGKARNNFAIVVE